MPDYKLTYFDFKGRAELIRLIFAYNNQKYEDKRLKYTRADHDKEWLDLKPNTPFEKLPILEVHLEDGSVKTLAQSLAIGDFLNF
jgi:prostaglandin-H2 D-isomerase / glutathione transferase